MRSVLVALAALALVALAAPVARADAPIQLALFAPAQIVPADQPVGGFRFDLLYGKNSGMTGVDWGLVNHTTGTELAWQAGAVNYVEKSFTGFQEGWVNIDRENMLGMQWGIWNQSQSMTGVAVGWVNRCQEMHGLQLGFLNWTQTMHGLQIGVGNIIEKGKVPFLPIVNWSL
jgi:hypothetical protein